MFILLVACSKDEDVLRPTIEISIPSENSSFTVNDDINVVFTVSDDQNVVKVELKLVDLDLTPIMAPVGKDIGNAEANVNMIYPLDDLNLASGQYYLRITAFDGTNEAKKYVKLNITGLPFEKVGVVYVSSSLPSENYTVNFLDDVNQTWNIATINDDYLASSVNSSNQSVTLLSQYSGDLLSLSVPDGAQLWSHSNTTIAIIPYFDALNSYSLDYVSFRTGEIRGYDGDGTLDFFATASSGYYSRYFYESSELLITQERLINGSDRYINAYYIISGAQKQRKIFNNDVVQMFYFDQDNIVVFCNNDAGQAQVYFYNLLYNDDWQIIDLPTGRLIDVVNVGEKEWCLGYENQTYWYRYDFSSITNFMADLDLKALEYDDLNNQLIVGTSTQITTYNFPLGDVVSIVGTQSELLDFHVLYNR